MPTATTSQQRRREVGSDGAIDLTVETTRNAQEIVIRSLGATMNTARIFTDVSQRVGRELTALTMASVKQALRMMAEMQGSTLEAFQATLGPWSESTPATQGWHRLVDSSASAFGRFAESMQSTAEEGTERIMRAVNTMADQVKENTSEIGHIVEVESDRIARATSTRS
ncbi:MAG: hypothetical protein ACRDV9_13345 [Acidimicrobiia bacterium]